MKLGMIMIWVPNLEKAKHFYCDVLGFSLKSAKKNRLEFFQEGIDFMIFECEKDVEVKDYGEIPRSVFVFEVASVEQKMSELLEKGVKFIHQSPNENDFSRYAAFCDPFGNTHEIFERK